MEAGQRAHRAMRGLAPATTRVLIVAACFGGVLTGHATAAGFRTQNFLVEASTPALARSVGEAAERYRHELADYWLGAALPPWPNPCPIRVVDGPNLAAQGVTQYDRQPVGNFVMEVIGTQERILDSVLPHEVTHTVLATHFGRPLPRWADEGICTTVEHASEKAKHEAKLREFLRGRRGIAMNRLFLLTEYPDDVLPMYAQGYSVCRFLIEQQGPRRFIDFLGDYLQQGSWTAAVREHYGYDSLAELQEYWLAWVSDGSGSVDRYAKRDPAATPSVALRGDRRGSRDGVGPASPQSGPATRLAAAQGDSFYQRRRDGQESPPTRSSTTGSPNPASAPGSAALPGLIPPSVRGSGRYSAAQPQAESGGASAGGGSNWAGGPHSRWR